MEYCSVDSLVGKTLVSVSNNGNEEIIFITDTKEQFKLFHSQDCCEDVSIESIVGDLQDLVGSPMLLAEESCSSEDPEGVSVKGQDSFTWTFYKFATLKGYVDIRWYGESNGYYSESVSFVKGGRQ